MVGEDATPRPIWSLEGWVGTAGPMVVGEAIMSYESVRRMEELRAASSRWATETARGRAAAEARWGAVLNALFII